MSGNATLSHARIDGITLMQGGQTLVGVPLNELCRIYSLTHRVPPLYSHRERFTILGYYQIDQDAQLLFTILLSRPVRIEHAGRSICASRSQNESNYLTASDSSTLTGIAMFNKDFGLKRYVHASIINLPHHARPDSALIVVHNKHPISSNIKNNARRMFF